MATQAERRKSLVKKNKVASARRQALNKSKQLTANTLRASKNSPPAATSGGSGGGKKPPTTKTGTAAKDPARGTGGRSGSAVAKRAAGRTEKPVTGSHTFKRPTGLPKPSTVAKAAKGAARMVGGVGGKLSAGLAPLAAAAEIKATYDFKTDKSRPTVQESAAKEKARLAKMKEHNFNKPITGKVVKGAPPGTMAAGAKKAQAAKKAPAKSATAASAPDKSAPSTKGGGRKSPGYTYTGPKVGSAEYKAMRAKKQAGYKAKARRNIAASRKGAASSKIKGVQRQQGSAKPSYESYQRGLRAPDSRQVKWTDNETTNQNLKATALREPGDRGPENDTDTNKWAGFKNRSKFNKVRTVFSSLGYPGEYRDPGEARDGRYR